MNMLDVQTRQRRLTTRCLALVGLMLMPLWCVAEEPAKPPIDPSHPLYRPLELAYQSRDALSKLKDYEAQFTKKEVVDRRLKTSAMKIKLREEPFSVYLLFLDANKGREVLFVNGKNNNKLLVHETGLKGLVGTVPLDPKSRDAMADNRYPVTMIGMRNMLDKIITQWETEGKFGETSVLFYDPKDTRLGDRPCAAIVSEHPQPRDQFKFKKTMLFIDDETKYPICVQQYGFPGRNDKDPPLVEEYIYSQIKGNLGLTDKDFDQTNPSYAFPR